MKIWYIYNRQLYTDNIWKKTQLNYTCKEHTAVGLLSDLVK